MKTIVIGSGVAGLTAALTLLRGGHEVEIFEQGALPGGVTQGVTQDGFSWDYGQLNIEGMGRDEPVGQVLDSLGILDNCRWCLTDAITSSRISRCAHRRCMPDPSGASRNSSGSSRRRATGWSATGRITCASRA